MASFAEALAAASAADRVTEVAFEGTTYRVLPPMDWENEALEAVIGNRFNTWARGAMEPDSAAEFVKAKFTLRKTQKFFEAYTAAAGQAPGESQPSQD